MKKLFLFLLSFIPFLSFAQGVYQPTGDLKQTGNYPIIWGKNAKGVPQSRATKAQMLAIPTSFRDTSMTCYVIETDSTYRLQQDLTTWIAIAPGNVATALKDINIALGNKVDQSALAIPGGIATLDGGGKIPMAQLPASLFIYKGMYNAATNTPSLSDATGTSGYTYQVNVASTHNFGSGNVVLNVGDYVIHNGSVWQKSAGTGYVTSVNAKQGIVSLNTDDITEGTNQYFTGSRAIGSPLNGYNATAGTISSSDNIVGAIGKLSGNIAALSSVYIQNQNAGGQPANFNINGTGTATSLALSGTDGSGNFFLPMQTAKPSAPASGMKVYNLNGLAWVTSNGFSRTFNWPSITSDRVATFTDNSGTVPFLESNQTWSGVNTFGANPVIKNNLPQLILTETTNGYSSTLSKSATSNNLKLTHQLYQSGGQGSSIIFNGANQVGNTTLPTVANSPFSISVWFKTTANGTQCIFRSNQGNTLTLNTVAGVLYITHNVAGATSYPGIPIGGLGANLYNDGNWHNVIFAFPGSMGGQLYVDGIQSSTNVNIAASTNSNFVLGANNAANFFNGEIDQFLFYNKQLTSAEANIIYNSGYGTASPVSTSLVRRWEFDEGAGTTSTDVSSSVVMTLTNGVAWNLNGKIPKVGSLQTGTAFSFVDGVNNGELGQYMYGDILGGLILQGKSVRHGINGRFPFLQGLDGHIVLDPSVTTSLPDANGSYNTSSILKLGAGTSTVAPLQFTSGINNITPLPGSLEYNGVFSFGDATNSRYSFVGLEKNQTFTGFNTFGGVITGSAGLTRGLYINPSLQFSSNNESQYVLDIAGSSISTVGGTSIKGILTVSNAGSGYAGGGSGSFTNVRITGGSGTGALASVTITAGVITNITVPVSSAGTGYSVTDVLSVNNADLGGTGSGATLTPSVGWINGVLYSIRHANQIIPANAGNVNLGSSTLYYANVYGSTGQFATIQALTGNILTFRAQNGSIIGSVGSTGNWLIPLPGLTPQDNSYKLDVQGSGLYGSFRSSGTIQNNLGTAIANLFVNILNPTVNNQNLILADFSGTFGTGESSISTGIISSSSYSVNVNPTSSGTASIVQSATNGSGFGAIFSVITAVGSVTSIQVTNGGFGYAVGNTITLTANGGTIIYTIPAGGLGLSGISTYAARFSDKITITPHTIIATPLANTLEVDNTNLYWSNSSAVRNQLAYLNGPNFSGIPTAPTATAGTNTNQIATTAFVLANSKSSNYVPAYSDITGTPNLSIYATSSYVNSNFKPIGYVPAWSEITNKPSFFSGSYNDLSNIPDIPNSLGWFGDKLLTNIGTLTFPISNSNAGSRLYIATNYSNGFNEVDYFSIPGTTATARGHHVFYTSNANQGTSGGLSLDFGTFGDNNAFTTGGPIAPGVINHLTSTPNRIAVFDNITNTIAYRTPQELASDIGTVPTAFSTFDGATSGAANLIGGVIPPGLGLIRINPYINVTSSSSGSMSLLVDYTDDAGIDHTGIVIKSDISSVGVYPIPAISIKCQPGTQIHIYTGSVAGSISYRASCHVESIP